jgi:adenosine deaminase
LLDLRLLPKAHLHLHLSGALRREPYAGDGTFATFLGAMTALSNDLRSADDLIALVMRMAEEAAADGVVWLEPSTSIRQSLADQLGLRDRVALLELLLEAAREAERETGVGIGYLVTANRTRSPKEAVELAQLAARYAGRGVVGFGLADDETLGPAETFVEAFGIAREAGLICAPHAGELLGPGSIRTTLEVLGARRIQHGVRAVEDGELVRRLVDEQICLDVCPTSNVQLRVVASLEEHPLPTLVAAGVPVSLNADCPSIFGCGALDEYELARRDFGFDDATLARIAASSIRASGAPEPLRTTAFADIQAWLTRGTE